jgi:hypothetical protein
MATTPPERPRAEQVARAAQRRTLRLAARAAPTPVRPAAQAAQRKTLRPAAREAPTSAGPAAARAAMTASNSAIHPNASWGSASWMNAWRNRHAPPASFVAQANASNAARPSTARPTSRTAMRRFATTGRARQRSRATMTHRIAARAAAPRSRASARSAVARGFNPRARASTTRTIAKSEPAQCSGTCVTRPPVKPSDYSVVPRARRVRRVAAS